VDTIKGVLFCRKLKNNIQYVEDSTNSENDYTRNKIRNVIFPYIENEMGYNLQKSFITLSKTIREEEEFLDDYVTEIIVEECVYDNENHPKKISIGMEKLTDIYEIDFKYDYATPFYKIKAYDKTFELAAVSTKNTTDVIMKNERKVMSYNSEYANEDHEGKRDEFVKILKDVIGEKNPELEVSNKYNGFATRNIYEDTKNSNEKRYQFTDKYDVLIQKSEITEKEIYTLVTKRDLLKNSKSKGDYIKLNAEQLIHDDNYLYVYNNGFLPYFSPSKKEQGWFNLQGKKYTLNNNVEIEVFEDKRLAIKRKPRKITYFASNEDEDLKAISPIYKEVIPDGDNYIVKNMNEKWQIVDKNFQPRTKLEYDIFISTLITEGIYIFANIDNGIEIDDYGYAKLRYTMIDRNLNVIGTNLEEMYNFNIKYLNRNSDEEYRRYIEKLKDPRYHRIVEKLQ